jgi:hypothetical protein
MRSPLPTLIRRWFAVLAFLEVGWHAAAQLRYEDLEPQLFRFDVSGGSLGFYAEGSTQQTSYQSGLSETYQRTFYGPSIGLIADGSIYHPDLFQFTLSGDGAVGWTTQKTTTPGAPPVIFNQWDILGDFSANGILLANKPYRSTLFVTDSHSFQEYDFFNQVLIDSLRYGFTSGYSQGPVPFTINLSHTDQDTSGLGYLTTLQETTLLLDAHNDRPSGNTTLSYTLDDFDRTFGNVISSGFDNSVGLSDRETFGSSRNIEWRNTVAVSKFDVTDAPSDTLTAGSHLAIDLLPNLSNIYDVNYLREDEDSDVTEQYNASASLRHQLYSSLTSGLEVQAIRYTSSSAGGSFESTEYIGTWSESYTKRLSSSSRLTIAGSFALAHTDQTSGGAAVQTIGEAHTFNSSGPLLDSFFLSLLNVNQSTIQVFDQTHTILYTLGVDYSVMTVGAQTLIRLIQPNPDGLTVASPVVVDYQAAPQGTGTIDGQIYHAEIRLDLLDSMLGFYGRYDSSDNTATGGIVVDDVTSLAFGTDFYWKWLRAGAEYQIYDSTFATYDSASLFQSLAFTPDEVSSLSLSLSEGWMDYHSAYGTEQYYSIISRYHRTLTRHFGLDLEMGVSQRSGGIEDQTLAAVRPGISYTVGQLSAKATYSYQYQETQGNQQQQEQMFTISIRRTF